MKTELYLLLGILLFIATACGSDSADGNYNRATDEELIEEQVDTDTKKSIDSVAQATEEGNILHPILDK